MRSAWSPTKWTCCGKCSTLEVPFKSLSFPPQHTSDQIPGCDAPDRAVPNRNRPQKGRGVEALGWEVSRHLTLNIFCPYHEDLYQQTLMSPEYLCLMFVIFFAISVSCFSQYI